MGAQFTVQGRGYYNPRSPRGRRDHGLQRRTCSRTATLCVPQKRQRKRERLVTMSTVSVTGEALLPTSFDKTAPWPERASCGKRADGPESICYCGHNFGDGSGKNESKAKTWVGCRTQSRESCTSETFHLFSRAQVGLKKKASLIYA